MERTDSSSAMASLANMYGEESDPEEKAYSAVDEISDEESMIKVKEPGTASSSNSPISPSTNSDDNQSRKRRATKLVSYGGDELDEEKSSDDSDDDQQSLGVYDLTLVDPVVINTSLSQSIRNTPLDEVTLPPEPPGHCSAKLQEKIAAMYEKVKRGYNITASILRRKDFRNPSIYEKLIEYCGIDEKGTNYPPDICDPHSWGKESFYDALAEVQKKEMDRREKERKDRTKVEFISGVKKTTPTTNNLSQDHSVNKKSKWDTTTGPQRPVIATTTTTNPPPISMTTSVTGTKTTVISAVGNITKK